MSRVAVAALLREQYDGQYAADIAERRELCGRYKAQTILQVCEGHEHPRLLLRELARVSAFQVLEVPLDYAPGVDARGEELIACGHINVYTPALFRFLLKSEGFAVVASCASASGRSLAR